MSRINTKTLIVIGVCLMVIGIVLPFLMVMHVFKSTYFLNFFAHGCQVTGMFLAFYGLFVHEHIRRSRQ